MHISTLNQQEIYFVQLSDSRNLHFNQGRYVISKSNLYADLFKESLKSSKNVFANCRNKSFSNYAPIGSLRKSALSVQITKADIANGCWSTASVSKCSQDVIKTPFDSNTNDRYLRLNADRTELHLNGSENDATCYKTEEALHFCDFAKKTKDYVFLTITFLEDYFTNSTIQFKDKRVLKIIDQA